VALEWGLSSHSLVRYNDDDDDDDDDNNNNNNNNNNNITKRKNKTTLSSPFSRVFLNRVLMSYKTITLQL
jgi:hypothetical protein